MKTDQECLLQEEQKVKKHVSILLKEKREREEEGEQRFAVSVLQVV